MNVDLIGRHICDRFIMAFIDCLSDSCIDWLCMILLCFILLLIVQLAELFFSVVDASHRLFLRP